MKLINVLTLLLCITFTACDYKEDTSLYESAGDLGTVVVVMDELGLDSTTKSEIRKAFGKPVVGLPTAEPQFQVLFTNERHFNGFYQKHHNIFILVHGENLDVMDQFYSESEEEIKKWMENDSVLGFNKSNQWAEPQNVFYVIAKDKDAIIDKLQNNEQILEVAHQNEVNSGYENIFSLDFPDDRFYNSSLKKRGYAIQKPESYRIAIDEEDFVWLRKDMGANEMGIIMYSIPFTGNDQFSAEQLGDTRTAFTKKYIPYGEDGDYMGISDVVLPLRTEIDFKDNYAVKINGWYDIKGDISMGGPYTSYSVWDEKNNRIVTVEGWVYRPNKAKAQYLREVEIIANSLEIND